MQKITQLFSDALKWIFVSSADPTKWSLTVKMALLGVIPLIMQTLSIVCGFALICLAIDGSVLQNIAYTVSNLVYLGLSFVAGAGFLYGLVMKLWRTGTGTNAAFPA